MKALKKAPITMSKWPNTTIFENILQFITVSKICRDLSLNGNSSLENSGFLELEFHSNLKFQISGKLLNISQTVTNPYIFS